MASVIAIIVFLAMALVGYYLSHWAVKSWYPKGIYWSLAAALFLGIGITALVGLGATSR